jgi:hypothetical protein
MNRIPQILISCKLPYALHYTFRTTLSIQFQHHLTMEYSPLDPNLYQIRVLRFPATSQEQFLDIVDCCVEIVSLNDMQASWSLAERTNIHAQTSNDVFTDSVDSREQCLEEQRGFRPESPALTKVFYADHRTRQNACRYAWGDFEALSYTWGGEAERAEILINGCRASVPKNLEEALRALRDLEETRSGMRYWVDYLCIDQESDMEKSHQVKLMKNIFIQARAIVVWLGKEEETDELAVRVMHQLCRNPCVGSQYLLNPNLLFDGWRAVQHFAQKRYWNRTWIVQELALNHHSTLLLCGRHKLTRRMVRLGASLSQQLLKDIEASSISLSEPFDPDAWTNATRMHRLVSFSSPLNRKGDLDKILQLIRKADATDPRDKVYGILGLLDTGSLSSINPNYSLSVQQVYTEFIQKTVLETGRLEHILFGGLARDGWPSWVPDWRQSFQRRHFRYLRACQASLALPNKFQFSRRGGIDILTCSGFKVDTVQNVGTLGPHDTSVTKATSSFRPYRGDMAGVLARTLSLNHPGISKRYPILEVPWTEEQASGLVKSLAKEQAHLICHLEKFNRFREASAGLRVGDKTLKDYFPCECGSRKKLSQHIENIRLTALSLEGREVITTKTGYLGLAPDSVRQDDVIVILPGCNCPVVLRPCEGSLFAIVGECYVDGIMNGELLFRGANYIEQQALSFC